jgi:hypothetical protein
MPGINGRLTKAKKKCKRVYIFSINSTALQYNKVSSNFTSFVDILVCLLVIELSVLLLLVIVLSVLLLLVIVLSVLLLLVIVLSVLLRFTGSDYPFGIFKHS